MPSGEHGGGGDAVHGAGGGHSHGGLAVFFQAIVADGFVQSVRKNAEALCDGGNFQTFIEQGLGLEEEFGSELVSRTRRGRAEERAGSFDAKFFAGPFHGDERHAKGLGNLALRGTAVGDELAGEKPERCDVSDRMGEDGKVAVEGIDLSAALLEGEFGGDGGAAGWKDGKLNLRHAVSIRTMAEITSLGSFDFLTDVCNPTVIGG